MLDKTFMVLLFFSFIYSFILSNEAKSLNKKDIESKKDSEINSHLSNVEALRLQEQFEALNLVKRSLKSDQRKNKKNFNRPPKLKNQSQKENDKFGGSETQDNNDNRFDNDPSSIKNPTKLIKSKNINRKPEESKYQDSTPIETEPISSPGDTKFKAKSKNLANQNSHKAESENNEFQDDVNNKQDNSKSILAKIKDIPKKPVLSQAEIQNDPLTLNGNKLIGTKRDFSVLKKKDQELPELRKDHLPEESKQNEVKFDEYKRRKTKKTKLKTSQKDEIESDDSGIEDDFDEDQIETDTNDQKNKNENKAKTAFIDNLLNDYFNNNGQMNSGGDGSYKGRKDEVNFFNKKYENEIAETGIDVNKAFEMEHVLPVSVALKDTGLGRRKGEGSKINKDLPAYLEDKYMHRDHPGTGWFLKGKPSGFNSKSYQNDLLKSIELDKSLGNAYQLNQLSYSFTNDFQKKSEALESKIAFESYLKMVLKNKPFKRPIKKDGLFLIQEIKLTEQEQSEAILTRIAALTGILPDEDQEYKVKDIVKKFGNH